MSKRAIKTSETLDESTHPTPFHVGLATNDIRRAMHEVGAALSVEWSAVSEQHWPPGCSEADSVGHLRVAHSRTGPLRLELLEGPSGSPWQTDQVAALHHVACWTADIDRDVAEYESLGWHVELTFQGGKYVYLNKDGETRLELAALSERQKYLARTQSR